PRADRKTGRGPGGNLGRQGRGQPHSINPLTPAVFTKAAPSAPPFAHGRARCDLRFAGADELVCISFEPCRNIQDHAAVFTANSGSSRNLKFSTPVWLQLVLSWHGWRGAFSSQHRTRRCV